MGREINLDSFTMKDLVKLNELGRLTDDVLSNEICERYKKDKSFSKDVEWNGHLVFGSPNLMCVDYNKQMHLLKAKSVYSEDVKRKTSDYILNQIDKNMYKIEKENKNNKEIITVKQVKDVAKIYFQDGKLEKFDVL